MKPYRRVLLASVFLAPLSFTAPALAQSSDEPVVITQQEDLVARVAAAQAAVAAAQAALEEASANGGDVAAAQAQLDAALAELAAAEAALAAGAAEQPPAVEEPPPAEEPATEPPPVDQPPVAEEPPPPPPPDQAPPPADVQPPPPDVQPPPPAEEPPPPPPDVEPPPPEQPVIEPPPPTEPPVEVPPAETPPEVPAESPPDTPPPATANESTVETQLEAQGDEQEAENFRALREELRRQQEAADVAAEQEAAPEQQGEQQQAGERRRPDREREPPPGGDLVVDFGGRFVFQFGDTYIIQQDESFENDRFLQRARDVRVERLGGGYTRTTVFRDDGSQIVTVRNRYGEIFFRTRTDPRGRQYVLIDNRFYYEGDQRPRYVRFEDQLPPLQIQIPQDQYIVEAGQADSRGIYDALIAPPVEAAERVYALEEVRTSERLRDKVRRVDLDTITFDFGSAAISPSQFQALTSIGQAMESILAESPDEVFLVEGHTDAVGSDTDNLLLSDQRAEAVAVVLSSNFAIPPENLVTQGYGEQFLKVPTDAEERENRRVAIRNITELIQAAN